MRHKRISDIDLITVPGPLWTNRCSHEGYVASYEVAECAVRAIEKPNTPYRFDLYVWDNHWGVQEICIRYGEDDPEYFSPGTLPHVYAFAQLDPVYARAVEILQSLGRLSWHAKPRFPHWRRVRYTDDGCDIFQCLDCKAEWEGRTSPGKFCPYCGIKLLSEIECREQGQPKWQYLMDKAGKRTYGLHPYSKQFVPVLGVEARSVPLSGNGGTGWHLKYISDARLPHTARSILTFVRGCRKQEEQRVAERLAELEEDLNSYDEETRENIRRMSQEWTRDEFRVVMVKKEPQPFSNVTRIYNRG